MKAYIRNLKNGENLKGPIKVNLKNGSRWHLRENLKGPIKLRLKKVHKMREIVRQNPGIGAEALFRMIHAAEQTKEQGYRAFS